MPRQKSRAKRFTPLVMLARNKEQAAAIALGTCNQQVQQNQQQLEQLKQYRHEYAQQLMIDGNKGIDAGMLKTYKNFISGLDQAIKNQLMQIYESKLQLEKKRQLWLQQHQDTRAMEVTVDKYKAQENRDKDRKEQNSLDEHASHIKSQTSSTE